MFQALAGAHKRSTVCLFCLPSPQLSHPAVGSEETPLRLACCFTVWKTLGLALICICLCVNTFFYLKSSTVCNKVMFL